MKVIKINRDSIKLNPRAGQENTIISRDTEISFEYRGKLPQELKDNEDIIITAEDYERNIIEGFLIRPSVVELLQAAGVIIKIKYNTEVINHRPIPKYDYEYEDAYLICDNCEKQVSIKDIDIDYDDEGVRSECCPNCKNCNTFEDYVYENIEDALGQT
jgi:hypothetical protein